MDNIKQLEEIKSNIENTLNYHLSLSNLELYHSNLFSFVIQRFITQDINLFNHDFFTDIIDKTQIYNDIKVYREKNSIDITLEFNNEKGEKNSIIIENKVKSLPDKEQLNKYSENNKSAKGILLTLTPPNFDVPINWHVRNYYDLCEYYKYFIEKNEDELLTEFLNDYIKYINGLSEFIKHIDIDDQYFLSTEIVNILSTMRIKSLINKIRYSALAKKLDFLGYKTYSDRGNGGNYFGIVMPIPESLSTVDIQIQEKEYRHKINFSKEDLQNINAEDICEKIKENNYFFNFNLENNSILKKSNPRKPWRNYSEVDYYQYALIKPNTKVTDLINCIINDVEMLQSHLKEISNIILNNI